MNVPQDWMPPSMTEEDKDGYAELYPSDPHRAAAEAWMAYAATLPAEASVSSVSTGDQSVSYTNGGSAYDAAVGRADWHLSRSKARSVAMLAHPSVVHADGLRDAEDRGTIPTYDSGTIPPNEVWKGAANASRSTDGR